jgi:D-alanyl-D-alanine carboxypeptidase/D-alanyl-D-alanine-endopeptidase (penicillin-binding protein 4)
VRRWPLVLGVVVVLVLALAGYTTLDVYDRVPGVLTLSGASQQQETSSRPGEGRSAGASVVHGPVPDVAGAPALAAVDGTAPQPTRRGIERALRDELRDPRLGGLVGATVRDGRTGEHLLDLHADRPMTPASNTKLLTAAAVSHTLDLSRTLETTVVQGSDRGEVVLVSGGDTMLARGRSHPDRVAGHAGLGGVAGQVADAR